jgi:hypothetical protein
MNNFNWAKGFVFGVVIWAIMLVIALTLGWIGVEATLTSNIIVAIVAGVIAYLFTRNARPASLEQAAGYGLLWAVIGFVLDFGIMHSFDTSVLVSWQYWTLFAAVFLGPLVHGIEVSSHHGVQQVESYQ